MTQSNLSRRQALKLGGAAGVAAALPWAAPQRSQAQNAARGRRLGGTQARNIIFLVSDGMSIAVPTMAEAFSQIVRGKPTHWAKLMDDRSLAHGMFDMASANSMVTDSAAASSSWGSGHRINNGSINVDPSGRKLPTITDAALGTGRRVGLVTTTRMTHATPAGFATQSVSRDDEGNIAPQYINKVDVLLGGGTKFFSSALLGQYGEAGYDVCMTKAEMQAAKSDRVLGLFSSSHLPYTVDHLHSAELRASTPTLAEMTRKAIGILAKSSGGFLLQVEGGRVDHAAHANDAPAILHDQLAFDDAVGAALEFAMDRGDTLVIVTTDHGNSNPGLNGMGSRYKDSNECFARTAKATTSYEAMAKRFKQGVPTADQLRQWFGVDLSDEHAAVMSTAVGVAGKFSRDPLPHVLNRQQQGPWGVMGQVLSNYYGVGWTGTSHTSDYVVLTAMGAGQERFSGLRRNTEAFTLMCDLMGVKKVAV
jgi:alkaline phosphatase